MRVDTEINGTHVMIIIDAIIIDENFMHDTAIHEKSVIILNTERYDFSSE